MTSLPLLLLLFSQAAPAPQEEPCTEGRISHVFVDNHSIFDPASMPEGRWLRWSYRAANAVHVQTRREFIEGQLPFSPGDCFDAELARESARTLREFRFIAGADVFGVEQPDGTVHVVVDTHDEWTTKASVLLRFEHEIEFDGASIVEENFLGRGIAVGLFYTRRDGQRDAGMGLEVPRIRGSRWDGRLSVGTTRIGGRVEHLVIRPFIGERPGVALRQGVSHRRDFFNYVLDDGELSHLVVPVQEERLDLAMAQRSGGPGDLFVLGGGLSWERVGTGTVTEVQGVQGGDFDGRAPTDAERVRHLASQLGNRQALRASVLAGVRRLTFEERRGLDAVAGVQDLPFGYEALLTVGPSVAATGPGPSDVFTRVDLFGGAAPGEALAFGSLSAEARRRSDGRWRDVLVESRALAYHDVEGWGGPTLVLRGAAQLGLHTRAPFQLVLGGPDGVRGYSDAELPGGRRVVGSAEGRWVLPGPFPELVDLGLTVFGDAGRVWPGDAPFGRDSGWRSAVGAGLRFGFPAGSSSVVRVDVVVPVDGATAARPLLRISAREWIGLLDDGRNPQLRRSRRSGLGTDFTGIAREQRPPG